MSAGWRSRAGAVLLVAGAVGAPAAIDAQWVTHRTPGIPRKVRERITRPDFGHLNIEVTVDDAKAYMRPWTVRLQQQIIVDTEIIDENCLENEKFMRRLRGTP
jgi:hypothetical protein